MSSRRPTTAPATGAAAAPLKPVSFAFDLSGLSKTLSQQQADTGVRSGRETLPESIERELGELDRSYATVTAYGRIGNRDYQKRTGLAIMTDKAENLRKMINKYAQADSAGAAEYRRRLSDSIRNLRTLFNEVYDRDQKRELREEYDILFTFDRDDAARRDDRRLPSLERQRSRDFSREREAAAALDSDSDSQDDTPLAYRRLPVRAPEPAPAPAPAPAPRNDRVYRNDLEALFQQARDDVEDGDPAASLQPGQTRRKGAEGRRGRGTYGLEPRMNPIYLQLEGLVGYMQRQASEDELKRAKETTVLLPFDVRVEVRISGAAKNSWVMQFFTAAGKPLEDTVSALLVDEKYKDLTVNSFEKLKLVLNQFYYSFTDAEKERAQDWVQADPELEAAPPRVVRLASAGPLPQTGPPPSRRQRSNRTNNSRLSFDYPDSTPSVVSDDRRADPSYNASRRV